METIENNIQGIWIWGKVSEIKVAQIGSTQRAGPNKLLRQYWVCLSLTLPRYHAPSLFPLYISLNKRKLNEVPGYMHRKLFQVPNIAYDVVPIGLSVCWRNAFEVSSIERNTLLFMHIYTTFYHCFLYTSSFLFSV